jgi:hypothetical protein
MIMTQEKHLEILNRRIHLKRMLKSAQELPETARGRAEVILQLEAEILWLKLWLNCAY